VTVPYELPSTLTLRGHFESQELQILDEEIADFEQRNSDVKVAILEATEGVEERQQEFAELLAGGDTSTDLYALDTEWIADFEASQWLMPLNDHLPAQGSDLSRLLSDPGRAHTIDGKLVALSSSCLPGKMLAISSHSRYPEQAFRFLASLLRCGM
jgi:ABC-type glycerol-3-phosphate transport system substrate-binding protein